ncbi:hypothetical protein T01_8214 [Trichinella spiralis]|uniref:Uncharacterized protein n=1 Tax=Trichinella spiralis TaxID=6334 RepID=A0A0V1BNM5_TRISP|nr:hypothetical protein T01_8214 [Trichinella spiralis]
MESHYIFPYQNWLLFNFFPFELECNFQTTVIITKPTGWKNVAKFEKNISFFAGAIGDDGYFYKNNVLKSSCDLQLKFASI